VAAPYQSEDEGRVFVYMNNGKVSDQRSGTNIRSIVLEKNRLLIN